jgi:hypothetical protein
MAFYQWVMYEAKLNDFTDNQLEKCKSAKGQKYKSWCPILAL